ncbi:MAG: GNAT family N-acetyltransferase [Clostridiaceae bacterium]|nr:GNAT family N-acetyltransferase [Clostridiaceae bacterium]
MANDLVVMKWVGSEADLPARNWPDGFTIRGYRHPEDLPRMLNILSIFSQTEEYDPQREDNVTFSAERFADDVWNYPGVSPDSIWLGEYRGKPVSTVSAIITPNEDYGVVHYLSVLPEARGLKMGHHLMIHTMRYMLRAGMKQLWLRTHAHRLPALNTYLKLGWLPLIDGDATKVEAEIAVWRRVYADLRSGERRDEQGRVIPWFERYYISERTPELRDFPFEELKNE